ncbi:MAG: folate family ECF transporter S component [Clostridia bacterium]|nr:folate family ECF transporter S component [Clostridia bacterium]MBR7032905.1 folate family ECF transporter S component [Clostridia bacterium]
MKIRNKPVIYITVAAFLIAAEIVLNRFASINTMGLKIGFAFVPPTLAAIMFGPGMSAAVWGLSDMLGAILFPIGPYHPGFTVCAALMGVISGFLLNPGFTAKLFKKKKGGPVPPIRSRVRVFPNVVVTVLFNCLVLGLTVNTTWVSQLYGSRTWWGWFLYRLGEYAILVPVEIAIIPILIKLGGTLKRRLRIAEVKKKNDA